MSNSETDTVKFTKEFKEEYIRKRLDELKKDLDSFIELFDNVYVNKEKN